MKTLKEYKLVLLSLLVLLFASCDLNREDYTEISPDDYPKTENDLKLMVNSLMYEFGTGYWNGEAIYSAGYDGYQVMSDMTTDLLWSCWGWQSDVLYYQQWNNNSTSSISDYFGRAFSHYQFMSKARNVIRRIEESAASEEAIKQYAGEVHALRGWMGLYLYDNFGPVPVATDEQLDNPLVFNRIGRLTEEQYDSVMTEDLNYAIKHLPVTAPRGRMTKGAAMMILVKYRMIQSAFETDDTKRQAIYTEVDSICKDIMSLGVYALQDDYTRIFAIDNAGNSEIILCVPCNSSARWTSNFMTAEVLPADMTWTDKSAGWGGYVMPWDFYNTFEAEDKRLGCVYTNYTSTSGRYTDQLNSSQLKYGALPLKYGKDPGMNGDQAGNDLVIFRYADVLLTRAECLLRLNGGSNGEATALINQVRRRAGLGTVSPNAYNYEQILLDERGHEFYLEGLRRQDLIRFKDSSGKSLYEAKAEARAKDQPVKWVRNSHNRYPIPQSYIDESKSAITQNPGY